MNRIRQSRKRALAFFRKGPLDSDLEAEIAAHLEMAIEENRRRRREDRRWCALAAWRRRNISTGRHVDS
jgi:hypothetical protein